MQRRVGFEISLVQVMSTLIFVNLITISTSHPAVQLAGSRRIANRERRNSKSMEELATASAVKPRLCNHHSGHTSTSDVSLCYKNGWFLAVYDDGTINGTSNARSPDIKLQLRSVGRSLVRIYSPQHCLYVAMASTGKVYSTEHPNNETVFQQTQEPSGFETFASNTHFTNTNIESRKLLHFLAMRKTGHMKNGKKTQRHHRGTLLSVMPARETY